jgi:tRNA wybutosine-synthesizing protein 4
VIAECVLAYLPPGKSEEVVRFFGERIKRGAFISYDPIEPDDAFGRQMVRNVESRGCAFAGIRDAPSVAGAVARIKRNGWRRAEAYDMNEVYARLDPVERARIERIELFDEFEEWRLIMAHYCVSIGVNDDENGFLADFGLR